MKPFEQTNIRLWVSNEKGLVLSVPPPPKKKKPQFQHFDQNSQTGVLGARVTWRVKICTETRESASCVFCSPRRLSIQHPRPASRGSFLSADAQRVFFVPVDTPMRVFATESQKAHTCERIPSFRCKPQASLVTLKNHTHVLLFTSCSNVHRSHLWESKQTDETAHVHDCKHELR